MASSVVHAPAGLARQAGRSFELPVFLAVIGVFLAIAVPACQDFVARKRVASGIETVLPLRNAIAERFATAGPGDMSPLARRPLEANENLESVSVAADGALTLRFSARVAPQGENELQFVPVLEGGGRLDLANPANRDRAFQWDCGGAIARTTVAARYLPSSCRPPAGPLSVGAWLLLGVLGLFVVGVLGMWVVALGAVAVEQLPGAADRLSKPRKAPIVDFVLNAFGVGLMLAIIGGSFAYALFGFNVIEWLLKPPGSG